MLAFFRYEEIYETVFQNVFNVKFFYLRGIYISLFPVYPYNNYREPQQFVNVNNIKTL